MKTALTEVQYLALIRSMHAAGWVITGYRAFNAGGESETVVTWSRKGEAE